MSDSSPQERERGRNGADATSLVGQPIHKGDLAQRRLQPRRPAHQSEAQTLHPGLAAVNATTSVRASSARRGQREHDNGLDHPKIDFAKVLTDLPGNPLSIKERVAQNLLVANVKGPGHAEPDEPVRREAGDQRRTPPESPTQNKDHGERDASQKEGPQ